MKRNVYERTDAVVLIDESQELVRAASRLLPLAISSMWLGVHNDGMPLPYIYANENGNYLYRLHPEGVCPKTSVQTLFQLVSHSVRPDDLTGELYLLAATGGITLAHELAGGDDG